MLGLIPKDDRSARLFREYGQGKVTTDWLVVAVESEDPFTADGLAALAAAVRRIEALPRVRPSINPFSPVTFERDGGKLQVVPVAAGGAPAAPPRRPPSSAGGCPAIPLASGFLVSARRADALGLLPHRARGPATRAR